MTQTIKPNDLIYVPHLSTCIFTAKQVFHSRLSILCGHEEFDFLPSGKVEHDDVAPLAYLATPEIKAKLEEFYGITLEDIPVDEELENFINGLNELSNFYAELKSSDGNFKASDKTEELKSIKSNLIQMFKERGSK